MIDQNQPNGWFQVADEGFPAIVLQSIQGMTIQLVQV
jgi:hypothetical protein